MPFLEMLLCTKRDAAIRVAPLWIAETPPSQNNKGSNPFLIFSSIYNLLTYIQKFLIL